LRIIVAGEECLINCLSGEQVHMNLNLRLSRRIEMTAMHIYWIMQMDTFGYFFMGIAAVALALFFVVLTIWEDDRNDKEKKDYSGSLRFFGFTFLVSLLMWVFLPSTQTAIEMYLLPKISNNQQIQNIGKDSLDILEHKMDDYLKQESK
jgi:hypothetical protein